MASAMRRLVAALVVITISASCAEARCSVRGRFVIHNEGPWPYGMDVSPGASCGHTFRYDGAVVFKRLNITQHPSHGAITLREGGHYAYASPPGFRGRDRFTLQVCGIGPAGASHCTLLAYAVTVR